MTRLAVDEMLGSLVPWLRALGLDAVYLVGRGRPAPGTDKAERRRRAVIDKRLAVGDRVFVTKSAALTIGRTIRPGGDGPLEQLVQVIRALGLRRAEMKPMTRCLRCNRLLKNITKDEAATQAPDYVLNAHTEFKGCPGCGRVYWPGDHHRRMLDKINKITAASRP